MNRKKTKYWFEKIDATSALPNFYPYSEDSIGASADHSSESIHSINGDNILTLNNWNSEDQLAV